MKKGYIALIIIAGIFINIVYMLCSPLFLVFGGLSFAFVDEIAGDDAIIEIDSYRLCKDKNGEYVIIIKYLLNNQGKEPTTLCYEGDFYVYQNGVGLTECFELPKKCNYDSEDQYKNVKGGVKYYAEIAYFLNDLDNDVQIEVEDYGFFTEKKEKVFKLN